MVARYASTHPGVRVIAIASPSARRADVVAFVRNRFGAAPIDVHMDRRGAMARAFGAQGHPLHRFTNAQGALTRTPPAGYPFG